MGVTAKEMLELCLEKIPDRAAQDGLRVLLGGMRSVFRGDFESHQTPSTGLGAVMAILGAAYAETRDKCLVVALVLWWTRAPRAWPMSEDEFDQMFDRVAGATLSTLTSIATAVENDRAWPRLVTLTEDEMRAQREMYAQVGMYAQVAAEELSVSSIATLARVHACLAENGEKNAG